MRDYPRIGMSLSYISSNDGQSKTLMVSENLHTWYWTYGDAVAGRSASTRLPRTTFHDSRCQASLRLRLEESPIGTGRSIERINGDRHYDKIAPNRPTSMETFGTVGNAGSPLYESYGYPCSNHPGGVDVGFCDGHGIFIADSIDPTIYGQFMTSNHNRSESQGSGTGVTDKTLPQPSDSDL